MKMKYKSYPQTYEKVFTSEGCLKSFDPATLVTDYEEGPEEYMEKFRMFFKDFDNYFWIRMVEYYWLQRRFIYDGVRKKDHSKRSFIRTDAAYSTFIKHYIGSNYQLFTSTFVFSKIVTYFHDFFGEIDDNNPFTNPELYAIPYKNISLAHLTLVYQMDERLDLLKEADEKHMSYYEFLDFVINYIYCVNDEMNKTVFTLYRPLNNSSFYIQYHFRKNAAVGFAKSKKSAKQIGRKTYKRKKI